MYTRLGAACRIKRTLTNTRISTLRGNSLREQYNNFLIKYKIYDSERGAVKRAFGVVTLLTVGKAFALATCHGVHFDSHLRKISVLAEANENLDQGTLGFVNGAFVDKALFALSDENQQTILNYVEHLKKTVGDENTKVIGVISPPYSEQHDNFTFFTVRDLSQSFIQKLLVKIYGLMTGIANEDKVIIFNIGALVKDVSQLKEILESEGAILGGNYTDIYKYLRATTATKSQAKSLTKLNISLQEYYDLKYPYGKIIIGSFACTPIILATAGSLLWTLGSFAALLSLDAVWCSLYENNKRKLILNHLEKMDNDDIPGMMTHLYRLQDHYKRTKSIEYHNPVHEDQLTPSMSWGLFFIRMEKLVYKDRVEHYELFVDQCIKVLTDRISRQRLIVEVDPYEIYQDDEGYDYYFMA